MLRETQKTQQRTTISTRDGRAISPAAHKRRRISALLAALRPRQWIKNFALFVGIVFAQQLLSLPSLVRATVAFLPFCLASSSIYLLNDLFDLEKDRQHPLKSQRPLASGKLPVSWAITAMGIQVLGCAGLTLLIFSIPLGAHRDVFAPLSGSLLFALSIASYMLLMILYNIRLKHIVLLDVLIIAAGFVLRILAASIPFKDSRRTTASC